VRYVRLHVSRPALDAAGGFKALAAVPTTTAIGVVVPATAKVDNASISRLLLP
jgi:hypothetical protein